MQAEAGELLEHVVVATFEMLDALQDTATLSRSGGDDVGERTADVWHRHFRSPQITAAPHHRRVQPLTLVEAARFSDQTLVEQLDLRSQRAKRVDLVEAILEHGLVKHRETVDLGEQHDQRRLPIGHEPRMRSGLHRRRA